jgi:hypothetical protein
LTISLIETVFSLTTKEDVVSDGLSVWYSVCESLIQFWLPAEMLLLAEQIARVVIVIANSKIIFLMRINRYYIKLSHLNSNNSSFL